MFKGENFLEFSDQFQDDSECLKYLSNIKWSEGYQCSKCGNDRYTIRKDKFSRECHKCHYIESPTAKTLFHKIKFSLRKAFAIGFEMTASTKGMSASQIAKRYDINRKTAWLFMQKVRIAMKSSQKHPIDGVVQVDEFVYGGKENLKQGRSKNTKKKKIVAAVSLTDEGKVERVYFKLLEDYSSKSIRAIFDKHISKEAEVHTDKWTAYIPLSKEYNIISTLSDNGKGLPQIHIIIHQLKSWLRSTFSWMHEEHIEKYLNEYSFRLNRSIFKDTIFHKLIQRMMHASPTTYQEIKVST